MSYILTPATLLARRRRAGCRLALGFLIASMPAFGQPPSHEPPAAQEPITPVPLVPIPDPCRLALGDKLFHDTRLSRDNARSCASCHDTRTNGATANSHDLTPDGRSIALNTPTIFNAALSFRLNWEGNVRTSEEHTERILLNPDIMARSPEEVLSKLRADPKIVRQFQEAYGREPDRPGLLDACDLRTVTPDARQPF